MYRVQAVPDVTGSLYVGGEGSVDVLGGDVGDWPLDALRTAVSIVHQHASLVSGTSRSNLS